IQGHMVDVIEGEGRVELVVDRMLLRKGNYFLSLAIHSADHETQFHRREDWYLFAMKNEDAANGPFNLGSSWCT
ncbi:MAG: Wzt carbohydrate-binding domain-containing protein, partial [Verrucomicrobiota bacterium]